MILLSVMIICVTGCSSTDVGNSTDSGYEEKAETEEQTEIVQTESVLEADMEKQEATKEEEQTAVPSEAETMEESKQQSQIPEQTTASTEPQKEEETTSGKPESNTLAPTPEPTPESTPEPLPEVQPVGYSPDTVVALAIAKCQASGMITTQDNLANALAEGRITQEEYNEYYPYDGLDSSYYSVFVETDLNIASTLSGQPLRSEDAIATYIADMLILETSPVFNIVYAGVYSKNGTDFYEFRCLR